MTALCLALLSTPSLNSALPLAPGQWQAGLFQPVRYAPTADVELYAHPLWALQIPNLGVKYVWRRGGGESAELASAERGRIAPSVSATWSTAHRLVYPTPLLQRLSRFGTGGVLPPDTDVPQALLLTNDLVISAPLSERHLFTVRLGASFGAMGDSAMPTPLPTIDLPVVFARLAPVHRGFATHVGIATEGHYQRLSFTADATLFLLPGEDVDYSVEQSLMLGWALGERLRVEAGYKVVLGSYPYGTDRHLLPLVDLLWTSG